MDTRDNGETLTDGDVSAFKEQLDQRLEGGDILRYHTAPQVGRGQTVGQHTWRGLVLLDIIWPSAPMQVWRYFLYHDVPELFTGDIPSPIKWANKDFLKTIARIEENVCDKMDLPTKADLSLDEQIVVEMIDVLELMLYCKPLKDTVAKADQIYQAGYGKVWKLSVQLELMLRKVPPDMVHQQRTMSLSIIRKLLD